MRRACLSAAIVLAACSGDAGERGEDGSSSTGFSLAPADPPVFFEPASGVLTLQTHRTVDVELRVSGVAVGLTQLVFDEANLGDLSTAPHIGALEHDRLLLRIRGGLASTRHRFFLQTPAPGEPAQSAEIQINVQVESLPQITATLEDEASMPATAVMAMGVDDEGVLLVYEETSVDGPTVHAFAMQGEGWNLADRLDVRVSPIAGASGRPALAGAVVVGPHGERRLRLAWRDGPGQISLVDQAWPGPVTAPRTALTLDALPTTGLEYASLGHPVLVGDTLLAEVDLVADTEAPRPGDHRLAIVQLRGTPVDASPPYLSSAVGTVDVDRLGPAVDLGRAGMRDSGVFAARLGGSRGGVFEVDRSTGAVRLLAQTQTLTGWTAARHPVSAVLGAFGSRTMLGVSGDDAVIHVADDAGNTEIEDNSAGLRGGGDGDDAGPPAVTMLQGYPVMLIPMGAEHPVMLVATAGARVFLGNADLLRCDEIALPITTTAAMGSSVPLACRGGNEVRFGRVAIVP